MKSYIALEIVRNKRGQIVDILDIPGQVIKSGSDADPSIAYIQILGGKPVQAFKKNEVIYAEVKSAR